MIEQLTHRLRDRYDRSMSETAVLERESTDELDVLDPKLLADWDQVLKKAGSDSNLRQSIMDRIKNRIPPDPELLQDTEEARKKLREMSQGDVDKKFKDIMKMPVVNRPDDIYKVDRMLDAYAERVQSAMNEIGSDSVSKGDVLRKKKDWSDYGWSEVQKNQVSSDLKEVLHRLNLSDKQVEIIMEVLLSKGKEPKDLTKPIIEEKMRTAFKYSSDKDFNPGLNDEDYLSQTELKEAKGEPEIIALRLLGVDQKNIQRHILTDKYEDENNYQTYYGQGPENIEDLAWYIMHTPGKRYAGWGVKGDTPLLEMKIVKHESGPKKGQIDTEKSGYRVNVANMVRWGRYGMFQDYDRDREDPKNFFESIAVQGRSALTFNAMLLNPSQYFKSEDGSSYSQLMLELYKEAAVFTTLRTWDVAYRGVMGNREELAKVFRQMFDTKNLMTRGALGANIMGLMTTMPLDFEGVKEGDWESDNTMGAAWIDIYRAYDSLSDYEGLRKVLGTGSKFFTQRGWDEAIKQVAKENFKVTGVNKMRVFMGDEYYKYYNKAFDENGEISSAENRKNFVKLINVFGPKMPPANLEFTLRYILRNAIAEKYGQEVYLRNEKGEFIYEDGKIVSTHAFVSNQGEKNSDRIEDRVADEDSLFVAEAMAWSMTRVFGAVAKNDPDGIGHDWMARVYNTQLMREKYPFRGDMFGNDLTFMQFKKVGVDPFNAIVTEAPVYKTDENGRVLLDKDGLPIQLRKKTIMEVLQELSDMKTTSAMWTRELEAEYAQLNPDSQQAKVLKKKIEDHKKESDKAYQNKAQQVTFGQRVLSNYWEDHLSMGMELYKQIVEAKEIPFEKFTEYTPFGGVRFKGAEFQEAVQKEWIHKIRYMIDTYPSLNFNMKVRVMDQTATSRRHWKGDMPDDKPRTGEPIYHEVTLGEAMFGHEMLNIPEFWKLDKHGKPINLRDSRGRKMKGKYEIDYEKVQKNKQQVWKQWFMMKVGADLYTHRALHANEPRFNISYYQNVVETLGRMSKVIEQNEYSMKDSHTTENFFNKQDMAWLKKLATVESFDLYWRAILKDVFMDDDPEKGIGLLLALSLAMKGIISDKV